MFSYNTKYSETVYQHCCFECVDLCFNLFCFHYEGVGLKRVLYNRTQLQNKNRKSIGSVNIMNHA